MTDEPPYIIVDNQKIPPIARPQRSNPVAGDRAKRGERTFGIVDRVTISREGLEKSRRQQAPCKGGSPYPQGLPEKPRTTTIALLTYSPGRLRP